MTPNPALAATVTQGWTLDAAPRLDGKVAIVTGATGGIGFETALGLVRQGATTILAGRSAEKGQQALSRIQGLVPGAAVRFERVDLASLAAVARFAKSVPDRIDILVNNAAVMALPVREQTEDGFETQIGVNYLAHFALTARLRAALCAAAGGGRVVSVASLAHRRVSLELEDLQSERFYGPRRAYARSKLAMLMFALELQRRAEQQRWPLHSIAAHPGWARTGIIPNGMGRGAPRLQTRLIQAAFGLVAQPAGQGALPSLFAAIAPQATGGVYYGPTGWGETRGQPGLARISAQAADPVAARRLWNLSEKLTGVTFG